MNRAPSAASLVAPPGAPPPGATPQVLPGRGPAPRPAAPANGAASANNVRRLPADPSARRLEAVAPPASVAALAARAVPANDGPAPPAATPSAPAEDEPPPLDAAAEARFAAWRRVLEVLAQSRQDLVAILKHTAPIAVGADALTLGYEAGNVLEAPMRSAECLAQLREAAIAVFGGDPKVTLQPLEARLPTLAETDRRAREREKRAAVDRAERHPSVRDAVEILGARVKRIEIGDN